MKTQEYDIEIITPCFCAGANQEKAEIRVPSIRGQVRWWFRAIGGSFSEEDELFGCARGNAKASALAFRLIPPIPSSDKAETRENDYLLWPLRSNKRGVITPPASFKLLVKEARRVSNELFQKAICAIDLWIFLGAIGTRSRRCAGSLWPKNISVQNADELKRKISEIVSYMRKSPKFEIYIFSSGDSDVNSALKMAGRWLHEWRAGSNRSGMTPKQWGKNDHDAGLGKSNIVYRPALGLPILQRYSKDHSMKETFLRDENGDETDRWGSPLHMKIAKLNGSFVPMIVFFPEHVIPAGSSLQIKDKKGGGASHNVQLKHDLIYNMLMDNKLCKIYP